MSFEAWPSPDAPRGPLPRIEDLPIAEQGYDQESVRRAFDDFYRHAAQLDASLQALEAVAAFQRDAAALRNDLRSLRALGLGSAEPTWAQSSWTLERTPFEVPTTALRLAAEAALLIVVAVIAGAGHLRGWVIVALMAAAFAVVWLCELLAARARTRVPASLYEPVAYQDELAFAAEPGEPAPYVEAPALEPAVGWSAFEAPVEDEEADALTMIEPLEPAEDTEEDVEPEQEAESDEDAVPEPDEPPPAAEAPAEPKRRGWRRRRRDGNADDAPAEEPAAAEPLSHVRVLAAGVSHGDEQPWERGFDGEPDESD